MNSSTFLITVGSHCSKIGAAWLLALALAPVLVLALEVVLLLLLLFSVQSPDSIESKYCEYRFSSKMDPSRTGSAGVPATAFAVAVAAAAASAAVAA